MAINLGDVRKKKISLNDIAKYEIKTPKKVAIDTDIQKTIAEPTIKTNQTTLTQKELKHKVLPIVDVSTDEALKLVNPSKEDLKTFKKDEQQKKEIFNKYDKAYKDKRNKLLDETEKQNQLLQYNNKKRDIEAEQKGLELSRNIESVNNNSRKELEERRQPSYDYALAKYKSDLAKINTEDSNLWDKTGGNIVRGVSDLFSNVINENDKYVDKDGKLHYLPSSSEIKQEKVSNDYSDNLLGKAGRFFGDVGYNGAKILGAAALDAVTAGAGGKALYWSDMGLDDYKNNINQGYSEGQALSHSLISSGSEFATEKLLGGLTRTLTGGNISAVQKGLANKLNKVVKNPKLSNILASAGSEGLEEFTQEYIDKINNLATLKNSKNPQDYIDAIASIDTLKDALYSGGVGAMTGAGITGINNAEGNEVAQNLKQLDLYKSELENARNELISKENNQNVNINNTIDTINEYENKPFSSDYSNVVNEIQNNDIVNSVNALNLGKYNTIDTKTAVDNYIDNYNQSLKEGKTQEQLDNLSKQVNELQNDKNYTGNSNLSFSEQIDNWKNKKIKQNEHLVVFKETPELYQKLGIENKPITLISNKVDRIYNDSGKQNGEYHGLKELVKQLPEAMEHPLNVVESVKDPNSIVVVTDLADKNDNIVLVSLKINKGTGQVDIDNVLKNIPANVMTSAYGKDTYDYQKRPINNSYDGWMKRNADNNKIIYDIDEGIKKQRIKGQWLQLPNSNDSLVDTNISKNNKNVKSDISTNSNMQQNENNTSIKEKNNSDILYETKEPNDVLVIKNNIKNKPLTKETTSDEINYVLNGDKGESKFFKNITENSKFITEENRNKLSKEDNIKFYDKVTNNESLQEAQERLDNMGENAIVDFFSDKKEVDSVDIATGWILLKRFQDIGDYDSMTQVAKKMRTMGTKAGQAIQTFNIMSRLTPEGMVKYAQSELMEAYDKFSENKSQKWIDENREDFGLTPEETQFIVDTMKKVETMEDGYPKKVELAKIQKMLQDKLPPEKGQGIKSWMRISMLFNPKTQIRNIVGNAAITPVNAVADVFSATADKILAKKTGVRTTGMANIGAYLKGSKQGISEATNDFKLGINTKNVNQNRFEVGQGKAFNEKMKGFKSIFNPVAKAGNKVDSILNYALDVGDRAFSQAAFNQSIQNQMILNNTTEITQDMIDIAEQEALSRTWNDDNGYTKFVLDIRRGLNKIGGKNYGLGDVLIPFAKTPANLTKAIVDYSPVGVVNTLLDFKNVKNNIETGALTPQMQHEFVQKLGKATAGTMLYILGMALAKSKITSGGNDDDKEVADFMRNTLGIQPYSIKIGNKSFTYDWAQPVAAPFAITADLEKNKGKTDNLHDAIVSVADTGFNLLMEQSFMQSINDVLSGYGSKFENIEDQVYGLPARSVPTFLKQINDMIDGKTRMVYEKNSKSESAINQVKTKTPGLSTSLPVKRDTLGREVKKYGGDNNAFNVFINPANMNKGKVSESAKEIYAIYEATKDKEVMPRQPAPILGLNNKQTSEFLKISGGIVDKNVKKLKNSYEYNEMKDEDKAEVIKSIVNYAYNKAKSEVTGKTIAKNYKTAEKQINNGVPIYDYYAEKITNKKNKRK